MYALWKMIRLIVSVVLGVWFPIMVSATPPDFVMPTTGGTDHLTVTVWETLESALGIDTVKLEGTFTVVRQPPSDTDWVTGTLDIEFIGLDVSGFSPLFGPVRATLNPATPSVGSVGAAAGPFESKACAVNVYPLIELMGDTVFNTDFVPLRDQITRIPPVGEDGGTPGAVAIEFFSVSDPTGPPIVILREVRLEIGDYVVIPTLTEWGMIIFCVLLFSWMAWVLVRRRKAVSIGG